MCYTCTPKRKREERVLSSLMRPNAKEHSSTEARRILYPIGQISTSTFAQSLFFLSTSFALPCPLFFRRIPNAYGVPYVVGTCATQTSGNSNHGTRRIEYPPTLFVVQQHTTTKSDSSLQKQSSEAVSCYAHYFSIKKNCGGEKIPIWWVVIST